MFIEGTYRFRYIACNAMVRLYRNKIRPQSFIEVNPNWQFSDFLRSFQAANSLIFISTELIIRKNYLFKMIDSN